MTMTTTTRGDFVPCVIPGTSACASAPCGGECTEEVDRDACEAWTDVYAAHYGPQDLLACPAQGNRSVICVYDMNSLQLVQTLRDSRCRITCLLWLPPPSSYVDHGLFLVSGDAVGAVAKWDVTEGVLLQRVCVQESCAVHVLDLLPGGDETMVVMTIDGRGYLIDTLLTHESLRPCVAEDDAGVMHRGEQAAQAPSMTAALRFCRSKLSSRHEMAWLTGQTVRLVSIHQGAAAHGAAKGEGGGQDCVIEQCAVLHNLITGAAHYDEGDRCEVVDAFFSEANAEVLYVAVRDAVWCYDMELKMLLDTSPVVRLSNTVFRRLFASAPLLDDAAMTPLFYSVQSDDTIAAWHPAPATTPPSSPASGAHKMTCVAIDVRGARMKGLTIVNVAQSTLDPTRFAALFRDGGVARWGYDVVGRCWVMSGYLAGQVRQPRHFCRVGPQFLCYALANGQLALTDAAHCVTLRCVSFAYAAGTRVVKLCAHRWADHVWVVSDRVLQDAASANSYQQVSLMDMRSGAVVRVLRNPTRAAERVELLDMTADPTLTYLLLRYGNGGFEIWNTAAATEGQLLYVHKAGAVAHVAWAPPCLRHALTGVQGNPQLLAVVFADARLALWSVYKDRVVRSRDAYCVPRLRCMSSGGFSISGGGGGGMSRLVSALGGLAPTKTAIAALPCSTSLMGVAVGVYLVYCNTDREPLVLYWDGVQFVNQTLQEMPDTDGLVVALQTPPPPSRDVATATAHTQHTTSDLVSTPHSNSEHSGGTETASTTGKDGVGANLVAALFACGSFAVWDVASGRRVGYSRRSATALLANALLWLDMTTLAVLGRDGCTYLTDPTLSGVNSPVRARALRRPLTNLSFLLPSHRTYIATALLMGDVAPRSLLSDNRCETAAPPASSSYCPAYGACVATGDACGARRGDANGVVRRGPFGHILRGVQSLQQELDLYCATMVPDELRDRLAAARAAGRTMEVDFWVARLVGQRAKMRFWREALALAASDTCSHDATVSMNVPYEQQLPYAMADEFSEACAPYAVWRRNRLALQLCRARCLQKADAAWARSDAGEDSSGDVHTMRGDTRRVIVARELCKLRGCEEAAIDVLLSGSVRHSAFGHLAALAVMVAAARGTQGDVPPALLARTVTRVADLYASVGRCQDTVGQYVMAGDGEGACRALLSQRRHAEAAVLAQTLPRATTVSGQRAGGRQDVLRRVAQHCSTRAQYLPAARLLLQLGMPQELLVYLAACPRYRDVAGRYAMWLAHRDHSHAACDQQTRAVLRDVLADYCSVLGTIGSGDAQRVVQAQMTTLGGAL